MRYQNYLAGLALASALVATSVKGDHFIERDRIGDTNPVSLIGFVQNSYKVDETCAKIKDMSAEISTWVKDHPASNEYTTGHSNSALDTNMVPGEVFTIGCATNSGAGTVYVTPRLIGVKYLQPHGVRYFDGTKEKNTKLTGENNTLNSTNYTYVATNSSDPANVTTNNTLACNIPNWSSAIPFRYSNHTIPNGTNTITLQTHYEPIDRTKDTNAANPTLSYMTNTFQLKEAGWDMFTRGDELGLLVQDSVDTTKWDCVDRRVFQTTAQAGDVLTFITPQLNSTNASGMPLERRLGLSAFSEVHGEAVIYAEGVGSSKSESTNSFIYEGHSGHLTDASNFQTTNGYVSTEGVTNNAIVVSEPKSLLGGIMVALLGYFSRKK